jgi:histidyl-tRNA synthetase
MDHTGVVVIGCCCFALVAVLGYELRALLSHLAKQSDFSTMMADHVQTLQASLTQVCTSNENTIGEVVKAMQLQGSTIEIMQKEKELLEKQLNAATEALSDFEVTEGEEDDEEEEDTGGSVAIKKQLSSNVAEDKLATIKALLTDAMKKNEQVNPASLLGIVTFKNDEL